MSPTILGKLTQKEGIFKPEMKDFRCMIDCVLIDNNYNGKTFNIYYSDIPKNKKEFVKAKYTVATKGVIAVKIIDMLGEEFLWTSQE